ncbi:MAG: asparagine synthase (glutamine-hydrolyzing) [candidate division KSB1 bacterium]|nr:asparagine synthase (glutamine-hydrolyzing) [candidate division KSB1 bacterium]MDZ7276103.1 asparagine synthase (glutamine-hydrolyzing) [candidate division KSB1 bacterium]MDZ7287117.1 asparagine synthase (glutamine-hydrolyzing) [candidate division KSB1 bacterium]MDZ7296958.1 asparagine synthase (glutamine-hydrolyzing) [candidate division KSB1 bacterium]MDZ7307150.1 asparagine synthase (glutamine-hydrolyzing) [candidate division KSB1 bacterium]
MCAIAGILSNTPINQQMILAMTDAQRHRGPDGSGHFSDCDGRLWLGHRRLSIIDLAGGTQPMKDYHGRAVIVYNGEVYNYPQLRLELEKNGCRFHSQSDTEVVLNAYLTWGSDCLQRLQGMFAFAIWQQDKRKLFLARDHAGIKPLHYALTPQGFLFSSELKGLLAALDRQLALDWQALGLYLRWGYIPAPHTIYRECRKLRPGHFLEIGWEKLERLEPRRYWRFAFADTPLHDEAVCLELLEQQLAAAVQDHMISDVPLGFFLSGGIDSSLVACFGSRVSHRAIHTFTMAFPEPEYDESPAAERIAQKIGSEHHVGLLESRHIEQELDRLVAIYDEPFADSSALPTHHLCRIIGQHVKVVLSGDGGDELWGGYKRYLSALLHQQQLARLGQRTLRALAAIGTLAWPFQWKRPALAYHAQHPLERFIRGLELYFNDSSLRRLLSSEAYVACATPDYLGGLAAEAESGRDLLEVMQWIDINSYLPEDGLTKVDRASMASSLEVRVPMLDLRMMALAMRVSSVLRVPRNGALHERSLKYPLRRLAARLLGEELASRPKRGFSVPLRYWFRQISPVSLLEQKWRAARGIEKVLNRDFVMRLAREHESGRRNHQSRLWAILFLLTWWQYHQPQNN